MTQWQYLAHVEPILPTPRPSLGGVDWLPIRPDRALVRALTAAVLSTTLFAFVAPAPVTAVPTLDKWEPRITQPISQPVLYTRETGAERPLVPGRCRISSLGQSWTTAAGAKTVTATPAVGDLIVVVHGMSGWASGDTSVVTDDQGGTYAQIGGNPLSSGGGTAGALWISIRTALISTATSTVFTATNTGDTGGGLTVLTVSGMRRTGAQAAKQQIGESTQTEAPPAIAFSAPTRLEHPIILAIFGEDNPAAVTPPVGFVERTDTGWATPTSGIEVCSVDAGHSAASYSWSGGALADHNEVGVELDTTAPPWTTQWYPALPDSALHQPDLRTTETGAERPLLSLPPVIVTVGWLPTLPDVPGAPQYPATIQTGAEVPALVTVRPPLGGVDWLPIRPDRPLIARTLSAAVLSTTLLAFVAPIPAPSDAVPQCWAQYRRRMSA
jgi:hypothetical protein